MAPFSEAADFEPEISAVLWHRVDHYKWMELSFIRAGHSVRYFLDENGGRRLYGVSMVAVYAGKDCDVCHRPRAPQAVFPKRSENGGPAQFHETCRSRRAETRREKGGFLRDACIIVRKIIKKVLRSMRLRTFFIVNNMRRTCIHKYSVRNSKKVCCFLI